MILAIGPMVYSALDVSSKLEEYGFSCEVVNCRFIKPMDTGYLESIINKFDKLVTIEEGVLSGGFGDGISSWMLENGFKGKIKRIGLPDDYVQHGSRSQIFKHIGLDTDSITLAVKNLIELEEVEEATIN